MDGTLIDSIAAVERSWIRWSQEYGIDPLRLTGFHGVTAANVIAELLPEGPRDAAHRRIREHRGRRRRRDRRPARRCRAAPRRSPTVASHRDRHVGDARPGRGPDRAPPGCATPRSSSRRRTSSGASRGRTRGSRVHGGWASTRRRASSSRTRSPACRRRARPGARRSSPCWARHRRTSSSPSPTSSCPTSRRCRRSSSTRPRPTARA